MLHLNPERAKLLKPEQSLKEYRWSSYPEYLKAPRQRVAWLRVDRLLGELGIPKDSAAGRRQLERYLEQRRRESKAEDWSKLRRGWYFGEESFREELLAHAHQKMGPSHYGQQKQEAAEVKAKRIVEEELQRRGWQKAELGQRPKGDLGKVQIARRLRAETTVTLKWVASVLVMGSWTYLANRLYHCPL